MMTPTRYESAEPLAGVQFHGIKDGEHRVIYEGPFQNVTDGQGHRIYICVAAAASLFHQPDGTLHGDWGAYLGALVADEDTTEEDAMVNSVRRGNKLSRREADRYFPGLLDALEAHSVFYRD